MKGVHLIQALPREKHKSSICKWKLESASGKRARRNRHSKNVCGRNRMMTKKPGRSH